MVRVYWQVFVCSLGCALARNGPNCADLDARKMGHEVSGSLCHLLLGHVLLVRLEDVLQRSMADLI
jgi:hypothetical protein